MNAGGKVISARLRRAGALLTTCAAFTAISCSSDTTKPPEPNPAISIALSNAALDITQGATVSVPVNVTRTDFTGAITLAAEGLPTGVTTTGGTIAAGSNTGTLTLNAAAGAVPGAATVTIRATGSGVSAATATLALNTRVLGTYALAATPTTLSIAQGGSASSAVAITRNGGFAGDVALTATAPAGITATVTPATLSGTTASATVNVSAAATVAPGAYTVNVTGATAGLANVVTPIAITVAVPASFSIAAAPSALSIAAGANATSTINITRSPTFTGAVTLTATAPAGITVTLPSTAVTGASGTATVAVAAGTAAGNYTVTVRGNATGISEQTATITVTVPAPPGFTLNAPTATLSLPQGTTNGALTASITRTGGFTGAVTFTADAPAGLTVSFTPTAAQIDTWNINVTAGATVAVGNYTITIRANAAGQPERTATLNVIVTAGAGGFTIAAAPTALTVAAGANGTANITIARTGSFTGPVTLTATTPTGVTATFTPSSVTGTTSSLQLAVAAGTAAGPLTVTVRGNATGMTEQTATIALTVTSNPGGGGNVAVQFCGDSGIPIAVYAQDGTGGWFNVTGNASNLFSFQINSGRGGMAYVAAAEGGGFRTRVFFGTTTEMISQGSALCYGTTGNKTVTATLTGVAATEFAFVTLGQSAGSVVGGNVTFNGVIDGPLDLIAAKNSIGASGFTPTGFLINRNLNIANGGSAGTINMAATFAPATATLTPVNLNGETLITGSIYQTPRNTSAVLASGVSGTTWYGIPAAQQQAGESHMVFAIALQNPVDPNTATRQVLFVSTAVAAKTVTFAAALTVPAISVIATAPYVRMRAVYTVQTDYNRYFTADWSQGSGTTYRDVSVEITSAYNNNGATVTHDVPDFTGLPLWLADYGLKTGAATTWIYTASGFTGTGVNGPTLTDGAVIFSATRQGTITP
jgi:trimeric autotransporter adhesin